MVQIPYNPVPNVEPSNRGIPRVRIDTPEDAFGVGVGRAVSGLGQTLEQSGNTLAQAALQRQALYNESQAKDLDVQGMTEIGNETLKLKTMEGKNAVDYYPTYQKNIQDIRQRILDAAPNAEAKRLVDNQLARRVGFALIDGAGHAATQNKTYANQTSQARVDLSTQQLAQNPGDDPSAKFNMGVISSEIKSQAEIHGWSPEQAQDMINKAQGKAWAGRIEQLSIKEPQRAQQLYLQNKDQIDGEFHAHIEERLNRQLDTVGAKAAGDAIMSGRPFVASPTLISSIRKAESGSNPQQISGKGAVGAMQLMPDTAREVAKQLGIPYDEKRLFSDNEYNTKLGTTYLNNMLQRYNGNETLATAAYNAGPGKVDEWIKKYGDPRSGTISNEEWAGKVPSKETRDYIQRVQPGGNGIQPFDPAKGPGQLGPMLTEAKRTAEAISPGDEAFSNSLENYVRAKVSTGMSVWTDQQRESKEIVESSVVANLLKNNTMTMDQLIGDEADPKVREAFHNLAPQYQKSIQNAIVKSQREQTIGRISNYNRLIGESVSDPEKFLSRVATDEDLTYNDMKTIINKQAAMRKQPQHDVHVLSTLARAKDTIYAAGLHESTSDPEMANRYHTFVGSFAAELEQYTATHNNKAPDDAWVNKTVAGLLRKEPLTYGAFGVPIWHSEAAPMFERDIPEEDKKELTGDFQKTNGRAPTPAELRMNWIRWKNSQLDKAQ